MRNTPTCDPYISVLCGKKKKDSRKNYIPDTLNPTFGELFEMDVYLPLDRNLLITVIDNRRLLPGKMNYN